MIDGIHLGLSMGKLPVQPVPRSVIDALVSAQVTHKSQGKSGFQLTFSLAKDSPLQRELLPTGYFDPPTRVILTVTINGISTVVMDGVITRHDVTPSSEAGQSQLSLTGADVSQMMDLIDFSGLPMPAMPSEAQVLFLLARYAMYGVLPKVIPAVLVDIPIPTDRIPAQQGTDYGHITRLADEVGYVFYVQPGPSPGMNVAYWGPEVRVGVPQRALSVNMDHETNVESLSFSFDGISKKVHVLLYHNKESKVTIPIPVPDVTPLSPPLGRNLPIPLGYELLNRSEPLGKDDSTAKWSPVKTAMRGLAAASQAANVITGSGTLDVLRYGRVLEARKLVSVRGAGESYDGEYYVDRVTHELKPGEYKQSFSLSRNAHVSLTGKATT